MPSVVITGCTATSLGSALAAEFLHRGCRVFPTVRGDRSRAAHLVALGVDPADVVLLDVTSATSIANAMTYVRDRLTSQKSPDPYDSDDSEILPDQDSASLPPDPPLDMLINNAGIGYGATFLDTDLAAARRVFDVNLWGAAAVTQAFAPLLMAAARRGASLPPSPPSSLLASIISSVTPAGKNSARVVNVGSIFAHQAPPCSGAYNASKAALQALSDTMRVELAPLNISVIYLVVGIVSTQITASSPIDYPPSSLYDSARAHMTSTLAGKPLLEYMANDRADAAIFAREVATRCLAPGSASAVAGTYWCGFMSWAVWAATRFVPVRVLDYAHRRATGLDHVVVGEM